MGRKNFGRKKKNQKKHKKGRKPSKGYPGIPQEQVTCREVAIYVPPDGESDQESDYDYNYDDYDDDEFYDYDCRGFDLNFFSRAMMYRLFEAMIISEITREMMGNRGRNGPFFSNRRGRR